MISRVRWSIFFLSVLSIFCLLYSYNDLIQTSIRTHDYRKRAGSLFTVTGSPSLDSPLVIVVCNPYENDTYKFGQQQSFSGNSTNPTNSSGGPIFENEETLAELRKSWTRQSQQTLTMIKTLLYFSKSPLWRIIVISDSKRTFQRLANLTVAFPEVERRRLILEHKYLWFPPEYPELRSHWRPCAWAKQFLAETLPKEDAVIYVDSDLLFLGPGEELWWLLKSMGPKQLIALAPEPFYKLEEKTYHYAGRVGLNTGVMAINLTRARQLPGGGMGSAILTEGPIQPEPRHDQDALNHFLKDKPHLLMEVTSRWNFLPSSCMKTAPPCPDCYSAGIIVLHGADMSFYRPVDVKFSVMYATLFGAAVDADPQLLYALLSAQLVLTDTIKLPYPCSNYSDINEALTLRLAEEAAESVRRKRAAYNFVSKIT
ncbi:glucoside xylosyltransferase 1-like [Macrobrachium rosenbergii]|uniref:glucoside xylosyltransferase 1-like n=1 Tax=Macrobrachium rosenbergii TaxID=79674 RepID=UPI0034D4939B